MMEVNNTTIAKLESTNDVLIGNPTTVTVQLKNKYFLVHSTIVLQNIIVRAIPFN